MKKQSDFKIVIDCDGLSNTLREKLPVLALLHLLNAATLSEMEEWVVGIQSSIFNIYSSSNISNSSFSDSLQRPYDRGKVWIYLLHDLLTLLKSFLYK